MEKIEKVKGFIIENEKELTQAGYYLGGFLIGGLTFKYMGRVETDVYKRENRVLRAISLALAHTVGEKEAVINHITKNINTNINTNK